MVSNLSSTTPALNSDTTISAIVRDIQPLATVGTLLHLWLPLAYTANAGFGRFFLARCTEDTLEARQHDWSIYTRRALFCASMPTPMPDQAGSIWTLHIPVTADPGYRWLTQKPPNTSINLLGPFGQLFELAQHARALLIIADVDTLPLALPIVQTMLDRNGRVTILIRGTSEDAAPLLPLIPIPVEVRFIPTENWLSQLNDPLRWADQLCAILPNQEYAALAYQIRTSRFRLDDNFAHVLVKSDLLCGVGACLACVTSTREGSYTRTCIHGPTMPLTALA